MWRRSFERVRLLQIAEASFESQFFERARLLQLAESVTCRRSFERARLSQLAETSCGVAVLKGHDFSRAAKLNEILRALAPEGCSSCTTPFFSKLFLPYP